MQVDGDSESLVQLLAPPSPENSESLVQLLAPPSPENSESLVQLLAPPPPEINAAALVLSDEDLLREILLRLENHEHLVVAAVVCKLWLHVASGEFFLRRFRVLHPPRLLGFCVVDGDDDALLRPQFRALPQHPGVAAAAAHRAKHRFFGPYGHLAGFRRPRITDCRDGHVLVEATDGARRVGIDTPYRYSVLRPPHPLESVRLLPPPPPLPGAGTHVVERVFLPEDGGDDHAITLVYVRLVARRLTAQVHVLGSGGAWEAPTTAETELPAVAPSGDDDDGDEAVEAVLPPINGEVYVVTTSGYTYTLGLRKSSTSLSVLDLPNAVRSCNFRLSWSHEDDDGGGAGGSRGRLCLVHGDGTQLSVWHRKTATIAVGVGWELRHTFCVREACQRIEWLPERWWTGRASVMAVGGDAEFALLDLEQAGIVIYVHLQWRTVKKVYERKTGGGAEDGRSAVRVFPLTTVWPPTFPEFDTEAQNSGERSVDGSNDDPDGLVGAVVMSCHEGFSATSPTYVAARGREDDARVAAGWFQRLAAVVAAIADCIA